MAIRRWNRSDPQITSGIGAIAASATGQEVARKRAATMSTVVATWITWFAPPSRKRSSWFTSSDSTLMTPPEERSSNHRSSRVATFSQASIRISCWIDWASPRQARPSRYSKSDSPAQITTVSPARTSSWTLTEVMPAWARTESSCRVTTSIAIPMSTGGARSRALLMTDQAEAITIRRRSRSA